MHKKLFIPGPVDVRPDVLQKMAEPMISHRGKAATALQKSISENSRRSSRPRIQSSCPPPPAPA